MGIAAILALVAQLVPVATSLIDVLSGFGVKAGLPSEVLALIARLTPIAASLVGTIEKIRNQTEAEYPEVWQGIRTDWMLTLAKWNGLQVA